MRRRLIIWVTVLVSVLAVALPAYLVTATPRDAQGELLDRVTVGMIGAGAL